MITEDQAAVIDFSAHHPHTAGCRSNGSTRIQRSCFLAGAHAWKLKRAVRFDYLDFSTVARRKAPLRSGSASQSTDGARIIAE